MHNLLCILNNINFNPITDHYDYTIITCDDLKVFNENPPKVFSE